MNIDYRHIAEAVEFYGHSYPQIDAPWLVCEQATAATTPQGVRNFTTFAGDLVASGEQSFIHLMLKGTMPFGNWSCVTPCFRDETYSKYHQTWFLKMELISYLPRLTADDRHHYSACEDEMRRMMFKALDFFSKYVPAEIIKTDIGYDVQAGNIELGSYGIREAVGHRWVYGTGCAEPRLSQCIKRFEHQLLP